MKRLGQLQELIEGWYTIQQRMLDKHRAIAKISDVTFSQWRVLEVVSRLRKATIKEIHLALGITSSAATQLVNELVKKKHVFRNADPHDGRVSSVVLSPKTKKLLDELRVQNLKNTAELLEVLSDREFKQYIQLNKKIIKYI